MIKTPQRRKVAILGGGMAAVTAAFELTSRPDWKEQFSEVAVYQVGWRLGGKAASGRNPEQASRIEELGPHIWAGFYDHAFRLVRRCYAELERSPDKPLSRWEDAFIPQDSIAVSESLYGKISPWIFRASRNEAAPGDAARPRSPADYVAEAMQRVRRWWAQLLESSPPESDDSAHAAAWARKWVEHATEFTSHLDAAIRKTCQIEALSLTALDIVEQTHAMLRAYVKTLHESDERSRRLWIQIDLAIACVRGALADGALVEGFDALDEEDFRGWLKRQGASPLTLGSALLAGLYHGCFASVNADQQRQNLAAGAALRLLCRLVFDYRGALFWKLRAGMGDTVFAPLYETLKRRGVRFHFFHRVDEVRLNSERTRVAEIRLERQATCRGEYEPLIEVKGLSCWPNTPRYELLEEGAELRERGVDLESVWADWDPVERIVLQAERDFDAVVLGISLAALPDVCPQLIDAEPQWRKMLERTRTVQTIAAQLWFEPDLDELGWSYGPPILTAFDPPLATWIDQSQVLDREAWDAADGPRSLASLCGALADAKSIPPPAPSKFPERQHQRALEAAFSWCKSAATKLWPRFASPEKGVDWDLLADRGNHSGAMRLNAQHIRANINPSDRYVLSVAGSTHARISPAQAWFENLFVCGDWTRTDLNIGCLEAAVMSGFEAAAALRGEPTPSESFREG